MTDPTVGRGIVNEVSIKRPAEPQQDKEIFITIFYKIITEFHFSAINAVIYNNIPCIKRLL